MSKTRSPNYPALSLGEVIEAITKIHREDRRNKMSRGTVARHLGYGGLSGPASVKIGALRAYGLLEGRGDELRVSDDAVTIIADPPDSPERQQAIREAALKPRLFDEIHQHYEGERPSEENLRSLLIKRDFSDEAASRGIKVYLDTFDLVSRDGGSYIASEEPKKGQAETMAATPQVTKNVQMAQTPPRAPGERTLFSYQFEPQGGLRLLVDGQVDIEQALNVAETLIKVKRQELELIEKLKTARGADDGRDEEMG